MNADDHDSLSEDDEDCECISCKALFSGCTSDDEDELRKLILIGRNKEPFPDWDMVSGFFEDWNNPVFRGINLYSCYRLMTNNYNRHQWMTGCPGFTNLTCLPCTLFGHGEKGTDFMVGEIDLPDISSLAEKHSRNSNHLKLVRKWLSYEQPASFQNLNEQEKMRIFIHDEIIRVRRALACFMIAATVILASDRLWFRHNPSQVREYDGKGRSELNAPPGPGPLTDGLFYKTLEFLKKCTENVEITDQCSPSGLQEWLTLERQLILINSIAGTIRTNVKSDLETVEFVSIIIDKPVPFLDIECARTSTTIRYVDNKGGIRETLLGFFDVQNDLPSLVRHLHEIVETYSLKDKLVGIACDGGSLLSTQLVDFKKAISKCYPQATFVNCYAHMADDIILQSVGFEIASSYDFLRLTALIDYLFRGENERQNDLRQFISERNRIQQPLNFDRKLILTINHYRNQLIDYFIGLPNQTKLYNIERNNGILDDVCKIIKEVQTAFCLKLFSKICTILEPVNNAISSSGYDVFSCAEKIKECSDALKELKNNGFGAMWAFVSAASVHLNTDSQQDESSTEDMKSIYQKSFDDILDNIINHITVRFNFTSMKFLCLLDPKKFATYRNDFPADSLESLCKHYSMFVQPQLQEELQTLYKNRKLYNKNITEFLRNFNKLHNGPESPQVEKLVKLIMTFPMCPISTEMSKFHKTEKYIRLSSVIDLKEGLPDLSVIFLEKSYIGKLDSKTVESRKTMDNIIDLLAEKIDNKEYYRYINPD